MSRTAVGRLPATLVVCSVTVLATLALPRDAAACRTVIGDFVWVDLNRNGLQDPGEPGINGVRLDLAVTDPSQNPTRFTTTSNHPVTGEPGWYQFDAITCGFDFTVVLDESTLPDGYERTLIHVGGDPAVDSNNPSGVTINIPNPNTGNNPPPDLTIDFGFVPPVPPCAAMIGDRVWLDANMNGIQDVDAAGAYTEPGVAGVEVRLRRAGETTVLQTTHTDGGGNYVFAVDCESYEVEIVPPPGLAPTQTGAPGSTPANDSNSNPSAVTPPENGIDATVDFGLVHAQELCPPDGTTGLPSPVGTLYWGVDVAGNVYVRYDQTPGLNDNSYGTNVVGWSRDHKFGDLVGSDKARLILRNAAGAVVLDVVLDYITATAGTPSGYASRGATGGDGRINIGQAAWILDWNSSLARNLNTFCVAGNCSAGGTNLLVNSPPTVSSSDYALPPGSPYVGWNFVNSYEMTVSAAAFGASGFGSVAVGEVHNSPPKIGSNAVAPVVCPTGQPGPCSLAGGAVTVKDKQIKWPLANSGASTIVLSQVAVSWPAANGRLVKVKFDGDTVWDARADWQAGGIVLSATDFTADVKKKRIEAGRSRTFTLEFERNASADLSLYAVTVSFGSGCEVTMPNTPPVVTGDFCETAPGSGKPKTLTMTYLDANGAAAGSNCATGCNQQDSSKVIVTGDPNNASPVWIEATPSGRTTEILFAGPVPLNGQFIMSAINAGRTTLDTNTAVVIRSSQGGPILSSVVFHTSCSQPLNDGDFYGSLQLNGFSR